MAMTIAGDSWAEEPSRHRGGGRAFKTARPVRRSGAQGEGGGQRLGADYRTAQEKGWPNPPPNSPDWRMLGWVGSGVAFVFSILVFVSMSTDDKLAGVTQAVLGVDKRVDRLEVVAEKTDQRLRGIESRVDVIDEKLRGIDKRLDGIDKRLDGMDKRLDGMDKKLDDMGNKLDRVLSLVAERR